MSAKSECKFKKICASDSNFLLKRFSVISIVLMCLSLIISSTRLLGDSDSEQSKFDNTLIKFSVAGYPD